MEKIITHEGLAKLVEKLNKKYEVLAPVVHGKFSEFDPIEKLEEADLTILNTTKPLKQLFLPQSEKLFSVEGKGSDFKLESRPPLKEDRIILGAKSCESKGIEILANVYGQGPNQDQLFLDKMNNTTIIGMTCETPRDTCFCMALGINPVEEKGMDIALTKINDKYSAKALTEKGEKLIQEYEDLFEDIKQEDQDKKKAFAEAITKKHKESLDLKKIKEKLDNGFEHPIWKELSAICLTCGICTYLCPSCQCFDIHDEIGKGGKTVRFRTWDTCMASDFTCMAGGHNPRGKKHSRFRQRFMHKFRYYVDHFEIPSCTGCGRCIQCCPVNIDILEILNRVLKEEIKEPESIEIK